jgi:hypothetical protein
MSKTPTAQRHPVAVPAPIVVPPTGRRTQGRRVSTRTITLVVVVGIMAGALAGYLAYPSHGGLTKGQVADAARWAGQAEAWLAGQVNQEALERGRAADAARWAAQAEAWLTAQDASERRGP